MSKPSFFNPGPIIKDNAAGTPSGIANSLANATAGTAGPFKTRKNSTSNTVAPRNPTTPVATAAPGNNSSLPSGTPAPNTIPCTGTKDWPSQPKPRIEKETPASTGFGGIALSSSATAPHASSHIPPLSRSAAGKEVANSTGSIFSPGFTPEFTKPKFTGFGAPSGTNNTSGGLFTGQGLFTNSPTSGTPSAEPTVFGFPLGSNFIGRTSFPGTTTANATNPSILYVVPSNIQFPWNEMFTEAWDVKVRTMYHGAEVVGKASATAMALVSPVWKGLLYPSHNVIRTNGEELTAKDETGSSESNERQTPKPTLAHTPVTELDLTEDDGDALLVLLNLVHYKFGRIPTTPLPYIYKIATLCHKYQCFALVGGPWLHLWMKPATAALNSNTATTQMLSTAWMFGRQQHFEGIAAYLIKNMRVDGQGRALTPDGFLMDSDLLPSPGIVDRMLAIRKATIAQLLKELYAKITEFLKTPATFCKEQKEACHSMTLGSLMRNAEKNGLWPRKNADQICISADTLVKQIQGFVIEAYHPELTATCLDFWSVVVRKESEILEAIPSSVGITDRIYMNAQRKKVEDRQ